MFLAFSNPIPGVCLCQCLMMQCLMIEFLMTFQKQLVEENKTSYVLQLVFSKAMTSHSFEKNA